MKYQIIIFSIALFVAVFSLHSAVSNLGAKELVLSKTTSTWKIKSALN